MTESEHNTLLLDIIISALKGCVMERQSCKRLNAEEIDAGKFSYLLGQSIRHWIIPDGNWHISEAAFNAWNEIVNNSPLPHNRYKEPIIAQKSVVVPCFKGNAKDFAKLEALTLEEGKQYVFNDIFIAEHTIPVADIVEALVECYNVFSNNPTELENKIKEILNLMHITQMLRIEDRRIADCQKRIPIIIQHKQYNGNVYEYLIDPSNNVFNDVVGECYSGLISHDVKCSCSRRKYKNKLASIKSKCDGILPTWAKAIDLEDPDEYSIKIV